MARGVTLKELLKYNVCGDYYTEITEGFKKTGKERMNAKDIANQMFLLKDPPDVVSILTVTLRSPLMEDEDVIKVFIYVIDRFKELSKKHYPSEKLVVKALEKKKEFLLGKAEQEDLDRALIEIEDRTINFRYLRNQLQDNELKEFNKKEEERKSAAKEGNLEKHKEFFNNIRKDADLARETRLPIVYEQVSRVLEGTPLYNDARNFVQSAMEELPEFEVFLMESTIQAKKKRWVEIYKKEVRDFLIFIKDL